MDLRFKELEKELLDMYESIVTYDNGRFINISGDEPDRWEDFKKAFPTHETLVNEYYELVGDLIKNDQMDHIPLPPFIVFPVYTSTTLGWRMGRGETYQHFWYKIKETHSPEEVKEYCQKYDYPSWWVKENPFTKYGVPPRYFGLPWKNRDEFSEFEDIFSAYIA